MLEVIEFNTEQNTVFKWLDIKSSISKKGNSSFTYIKVIRKGLQSKSIDSFIKYSSLSKKQVSKLIHISERTLQRNALDKKIDTNSSEKLIELARLFHKGIEVFESREKFIIWLNRSNEALENQSPFELMESNFGINLVIDELIRIEHGVFS